jgi:folate-binding protein YgfZ
MKTYSLIELAGPDAVDFGHRMFSRNLKTLSAHEGRLTLFLSAEGKVQSIFWMIKTTAGLRLIVEQGQQQALMDLVERYHFSESFKAVLGPTVSSSWRASPNVGAGVGFLKDQQFVGVWRGTEWIFDLDHPPTSQQPGWSEHRIQNLIPEWGLDFDTSTLVFEPGLEELCDENKGCYIGQEIVERVRSRGGQAPRSLALLEWSQKPQAKSRSIFSPSQETIGASTETDPVEVNGKWLGLGYLRRGFGAEGSQIQAQGVSGRCLRSI